MRSPPQNWQPSQSPWPPHSNAVESRLTRLETDLNHHEDRHEETLERLDKQDRRLNLHEKAILAFGALLQILLQDKYPALAALIKGMMQ